MDDIVVIILTLAVAGIGLLGQLKKKKQNTTPPKQSGQPNNIWDLINKGFDAPAQEVHDDNYEEKDTEQIITPKTEYQKTSMESKRQSVMKDKLTEKAVRKKSKSKIMEGFSLRKAVVYSEIINRKYT